MPAPDSFEEIHTDEPKDLWSANDQTNRARDQRMTHSGIAGFGTAAAYAGALGKTDGAAKLEMPPRRATAAATT